MNHDRINLGRRKQEGTPECQINLRNRKARMNRTLDQYAKCDPFQVVSGSHAQALHFAKDAKADIAELAARIAALEAENERLRKERDELAGWIKDCTAKISNVIGGGSELFNRHGEQFRLDADFVCQRISTMRERHHDAMHRAVRAERAALEAKP